MTAVSTPPLHLCRQDGEPQRAPRVLFYVQHLLGTGHIRRALTLADTMREEGCHVRLVSGGREIPETRLDTDLVQLPPLHARDQSFRELLDDQDNPIDDSWKATRCRLLIEHYERFRPQVLIIESYPFGRRKLSFELEPLLRAVHQTAPRPLVVCSVRDIVQSRSNERARETAGMLSGFFDLVMVHGDPDLVRFEESFSAMAGIETLFQYTGYVANTLPSQVPRTGRKEVIVSGGGGAVGVRLFRTALEARGLSEASRLQWRILVGGNTPEHDFDSLQAQCDDGVMVERNRDDFQTLLSNCAVSVSQAGYNTVMDILGTGARAVVVPFEGQGETEQRLRATKLHQRGLVEMVTEDELSAPRLAEAIDRRLAVEVPGPCPFDLDGAAAASRLIVRTWNEYRIGN